MRRVNIMCKIIEFKPRQRNGYLNLKELFEICNNVKSCDFYLGLVEYLYNGDHITEKEMYGLRRIGKPCSFCNGDKPKSGLFQNLGDRLQSRNIPFGISGNSFGQSYFLVYG